jgi:hypothetical protein
MNSNLVPELRTDKNGVTRKRWVKPSGAEASKKSSIPAPSTASTNRRQLLKELAAGIKKSGRTASAKDEDIALVNDLAQMGLSSQMDLLHILHNNVDSKFPFSSIEMVYTALRENRIRSEDITGFINEESLDAAQKVVVGSHRGAERILSEDTKELITFALTSAEDMELFSKLVYDRKCPDLSAAKELYSEAIGTQGAIRAGVL